MITTRLDFRPPPLLGKGAVQTLLGTMLPSEILPEDARHEVQLEDGDRLLMFENRPDRCRTTDRSVLLLHGLGGCHQSGYMMRIARRLNQRGVRTFRIAMRGVAAGAQLARRPMHAGRWHDAVAALCKIADVAPKSPTTLLGFSLGANVALLASARAAQALGGLGNCDSCIAVSPPAELLKCCEHLMKGPQRFYDRYLLRFMLDQLENWWSANPAAHRVALPRRPRSIYEFDQRITAPLGGFRDAEHYYSDSSCGPRLIDIQIPTRILAAVNDPMIPIDLIRGFARPANVELFETHSGGHMGYVAQKSQCKDRRWLDELLTDWICGDSDWIINGTPAN